MARIGKQLIINPQNSVGTEARPNLPQVNVLLIVLELRLAAEELRTHSKQYILGPQTVLCPCQIAHWSTGLPDNVKDNILALIILCRLLLGSTSAKVDPLEHFTWLVVIKLCWLIYLHVPRHLTNIRLDVRDGSTEPPLNLLASFNELIHSSLGTGHFELSILLMISLIVSLRRDLITIILNIIHTIKVSIEHLLLNALVLPSAPGWLEAHDLLRLLLGDNLATAIINTHIKDHDEQHGVPVFFVVVDGPVQQVVNRFDIRLQHDHGFFRVLIYIFVGLENTIRKLHGRVAGLVELLTVDSHHDLPEVGRLALVRHNQQML
jgi:hypothetical protein